MLADEKYEADEQKNDRDEEVAAAKKLAEDVEDDPADGAGFLVSDLRTGRFSFLFRLDFLDMRSMGLLYVPRPVFSMCRTVNQYGGLSFG